MARTAPEAVTTADGHRHVKDGRERREHRKHLACSIADQRLNDRISDMPASCAEIEVEVSLGLAR
jgi:hypothetical protein